MRRFSRACWRLCEDQGSFALPAIVVVFGVFLLLEVFFAASWGSGSTVRPREYMLNCWLLLVLGVSYVVWTALRSRGAVHPAAAQRFVLAAFGFWARVYCSFLLYGFTETYGDHSVAEEFATDRLRFLIGVHRYGGLLAFVLGLALVAWESRRPPIRSPAG